MVIIRGPVRVYYDDVNLGLCSGDVELVDEPQFVEAKVTEYGESIYNEMQNGMTMTVTVPFTELSNTALVKLGGVLDGSDVVFSSNVGTLTRSLAKELVLIPVIDQTESADTKTFTTIYSAYPKRKFNTTYGPSQRIQNIEFQSYPSLESGLEGRHYKVGENA